MDKIAKVSSLLSFCLKRGERRERGRKTLLVCADVLGGESEVRPLRAAEERIEMPVLNRKRKLPLTPFRGKKEEKRRKASSAGGTLRRTVSLSAEEGRTRSGRRAIDSLRTEPQGTEAVLTPVSLEK